MSGLMQWLILKPKLPDPSEEKTPEAAKRVEAANKAVEAVLS
jgi:hypothetical protein